MKPRAEMTRDELKARDEHERALRVLDRLAATPDPMAAELDRIRRTGTAVPPDQTEGA